MNTYYNKYKSSIGLQMISAVIIGTIFGSLLPQFSSIYQFLGKSFYIIGQYGHLTIGISSHCPSLLLKYLIKNH